MASKMPQQIAPQIQKLFGMNSNSSFGNSNNSFGKKDQLLQNIKRQSYQHTHNQSYGNHLNSAAPNNPSESVLAQVLSQLEDLRNHQTALQKQNAELHYKNEDLQDRDILKKNMKVKFNYKRLKII
eukprot:263448_1